MALPDLLAQLSHDTVASRVAMIAAMGFVLPLLVYAFVLPILSEPKLPQLDIAMKDELPSRKARLHKYTVDTRNLLISGYQNYKDRVFGIDTTEGTNIVLPLKYLDELRTHRSLSFSDFLNDEFTLKQYTKLGNLPDQQIAVVNRQVNPSLPRYVPVIEILIQETWPFPVYKQKSTVKPYSDINRVSSRVCARFFHGQEAAHSDEWIDVASMYLDSAQGWVGNLKQWPKVLRPFVWRFVPGRKQMMDGFNDGAQMVQRTLEQKKRNGNKPLNDPPSLMDLLSSDDWANSVNDLEMQTITQMNLCVAAIQAIGATVMQVLVDLGSYPDYIPELREEITQALASTDGKWTKQSLGSLMRLDSFMKETQRLNTPDLTSFQRKVVDQFTLSNGMQIPKGARLVLPSGAINVDPQFFENPSEFDGYRFYRKRMASEEAQTRHQLVSVGKTDLVWGYGRHACPGRFIADLAMKLMVIEFIRRYDLSRPKGSSRPKNVEFEGILAPDEKWELELKSVEP